MIIVNTIFIAAINVVAIAVMASIHNDALLPHNGNINSKDKPLFMYKSVYRGCVVKDSIYSLQKLILEVIFPQ